MKASKEIKEINLDWLNTIAKLVKRNPKEILEQIINQELQQKREMINLPKEFLELL